MEIEKRRLTFREYLEETAALLRMLCPLWAICLLVSAGAVMMIVGFLMISGVLQ